MSIVLLAQCVHEVSFAELLEEASCCSIHSANNGCVERLGKTHQHQCLHRCRDGACDSVIGKATRHANNKRSAAEQALNGRVVEACVAEIGNADDAVCPLDLQPLLLECLSCHGVLLRFSVMPSFLLSLFAPFKVVVVVPIDSVFRRESTTKSIAHHLADPF